MLTPDNEKPLESFKVGPDRAAFFGELLIIDAMRPMPDWKVREFARKPVYFREKKYALRSKTEGEKPFAVRYILEPWPADFSEPLRDFLVYDEETVAHRDAAVHRERINDAAHYVLLPFYPLLGFLWSGTKDKLARLGFEPRSVTSASILVTFLFLMLEFVFATVLVWVSVRSGRLMLGGMLRLLWGSPEIRIFGLALPFVVLESGLVILLIADLLARYSQHLKGSENTPHGFLEWLVRA